MDIRFFVIKRIVSKWWKLRFFAYAFLGNLSGANGVFRLWLFEKICEIQSLEGANKKEKFKLNICILEQIQSNSENKNDRKWTLNKEPFHHAVAELCDSALPSNWRQRPFTVDMGPAGHSGWQCDGTIPTRQKTCETSIYTSNIINCYYCITEFPM